MSNVNQTRGSKILLLIVKYLGAYLLGIAVCMFVTPAELNLDRHPSIILFYLIFSVPFFFLWPYLVFNESPELYLWWMWLIALAPLVGEAIAFSIKKVGFSAWRPLWVGFPVGFVGSFAMYWAFFLNV